MNKEIFEKFNKLFDNQQKHVYSGIKTIDNYIGGFIPGTFIGLGGNFSTGKTTLALQIALNYLKQEDKNCLYIDTEHAISKDYLDNLKVDKEKFIYCETNSLEDIESVIKDSIESGLFGVIIIDSVTGIISNDIYDDLIKLYSRLEKLISENKILLIGTEQEDIQKSDKGLVKQKYKKLLYFYNQYIGLYLTNANEKDSNIELKSIKNKNRFEQQSIRLNLNHRNGFI